MSSLRFGDSTGQIQNQPVQNVFRSVEELTRLLKQTNSQVAEARDRIRQLERLLEMGPDDYEDDEVWALQYHGSVGAHKDIRTQDNETLLKPPPLIL